MRDRLCTPRRKGGCSAVFQGSAAAHGRSAPRDCAVRRLYGGGTRGHRPALDPRAAAGRARPGPGRQRDGPWRRSARRPSSCSRNSRPSAWRARSAGRLARARELDHGAAAAAKSARHHGCRRAARAGGARSCQPRTPRTDETFMKLPPKLGPIHFIGIGGIGMSGIAEVMHNLGYTVQGSDATDNYNVRRLAEKGIRTFIGHKAENIDGAEIVVVSTAIKRDNPELLIGAREAPAGRAPRRNAGRADALQVLRRRRRHARQDDDDLARRDAARRRRSRSDGDQRRHHQRLRHQRPHGRGRVDGGRGGRVRRHLPEAARRRRRSSPISTPSISTTSTRSMRSRTRSAPSSTRSRSTASP